MRSDLVAWIDAPDPTRGISFRTRGEWILLTFATLAQGAINAAHALVDAGLRPGGTAVLAYESSPAFVSAFFGTLLAGGTPSCIAPPQYLDFATYGAHVAGALRMSEPDVVVSSESNHRTITGLVTDNELPPAVLCLELDDSPGRDAPGVALSDVALLQFTSGSSGRPRGVVVGRSNLEANISQIQRWLRITRHDALATWLPLHHDMGLVGCLLTPIVGQNRAFVMRPEQFLQDPMAWLECFGRRDATIAAAPNFGVAYLVRHLRRRGRAAALESMDFCNWHTLILGAERLDAGSMSALLDLLGPAGFDATVFRPAYGLAEATLAVSGVGREKTARAISIDWSSLRHGDRVKIEASAPIGPGGADGGDWIVGCGKPLDATAVRVVDDDGEEVGDGIVGELVVKGPSVARGYRGGNQSGVTWFDGEWLRTGDAGFIHEKELFVIGRIGDSIAIRGRQVYAEDVEVRFAASAGMARERVVVVPDPGADGEGIALLIDGRPGDWMPEAVRALRRAVGESVAVRIFTGRSIIARTTSGKPRRRVMWQRLFNGELGVEPAMTVLAGSAPVFGDEPCKDDLQ